MSWDFVLVHESMFLRIWMPAVWVLCLESRLIQTIETMEIEIVKVYFLKITIQNSSNNNLSIEFYFWSNESEANAIYEIMFWKLNFILVFTKEWLRNGYFLDRSSYWICIIIIVIRYFLISKNIIFHLKFRC